VFTWRAIKRTKETGILKKQRPSAMLKPVILAIQEAEIRRIPV
jgi:hypothetical protein